MVKKSRVAIVDYRKEGKKHIFLFIRATSRKNQVISHTYVTTNPHLKQLYHIINNRVLAGTGSVLLFDDGWQFLTNCTEIK